MFENIPKNWKKDKLKNYIDIIRGVNYNSNEAYDVVTPDTTTLLRDSVEKVKSFVQNFLLRTY